MTDTLNDDQNDEATVLPESQEPTEATREAIEAYKAFVDAFVDIRPALQARYVRDGFETANPAHFRLKTFIDGLTDEQREVLAEFVQGTRDSALNRVLGFLHDSMDCEDEPELQIIYHGKNLPVAPFRYKLFEVWRHRIDGGSWEELEEEMW